MQNLKLVNTLQSNIVETTVNEDEIERLRKIEEKYKFLTKIFPISIYEIDTAGNILSMNSEGLKMLGFNNEKEVLKKKFHRIVSLDDQENIKNLISEVINGEEKTFEFMGKIDEERYFISNLIPVENSQGKVIKIMGITQEITDLRMAEKSIREHEAQLRQIIDLVPHMIFAKDEDGNFILANKAVADAYGSTTEELTGSNHSVVHLESSQVAQMLIDDREVLKNNQQKVIEEENFVDSQGNHRILHKTKIPFTPPGNKKRAVLGVATDITELKEAQEKLENIIEELVKSNTDLERFAYVASHDLREPLRTISSYTQLLNKKYSDLLDEKGKEYLSHATNSATRMNELVTDLLNYSKLNRKDVNFKPVNCKEIVEYVIASLHEIIEENNATITYGKMPEITADKTQIAQLFQNLINNALKYRSEKPAKIHIEAKLDDDKWLFSVKDNGIGIKQQDIGKIFQIFKRAHDKSKRRGTGIGLAVCKKVVSNHQGTIWVKSQKGKGSTFYFTLSKDIK